MCTYIFEIEQAFRGKITVQSDKETSAEVLDELRPKLEALSRIQDFPGIEMREGDELTLVGVTRIETKTLPSIAS